jgi:hypothetical protein
MNIDNRNLGLSLLNGLRLKSRPDLTIEAQVAIRDYVVGLLTLPAAVTSVLIVIGGWWINTASVQAARAGFDEKITEYILKLNDATVRADSERGRVESIGNEVNGAHPILTGQSA